MNSISEHIKDEQKRTKKLFATLKAIKPKISGSPTYNELDALYRFNRSLAEMIETHTQNNLCDECKEEIIYQDNKCWGCWDVLNL